MIRVQLLDEFGRVVYQAELRPNIMQNVLFPPGIELANGEHLSSLSLQVNTRLYSNLELRNYEQDGTAYDNVIENMVRGLNRRHIESRQDDQDYNK